MSTYALHLSIKPRSIAIATFNPKTAGQSLPKASDTPGFEE
ncbi:hypothetical protein [Scytonema sp. PCC 10023]